MTNQPTNDNAKRLAATLEKARIALDLETLEERKSDRLDFHSMSVASIRAIIEMAFTAGVEAGKAGK